MASIEQLKASDGSGNANVATIQNIRSPGASTIIVDTVLGINPGGFAGSMGTPHTFTDPITSEVITVISEATAVDFTGHVDSGNLEIDDIAPGYTDAGSEVGDIVIIRPTTQWSDELAEILEVTHNDDGTLKNSIVATANIQDDAVTAPKLVGIDRSNLTTDSNPYKFSAYPSGAQTVPASFVPGKIALGTEIYDTNNNFDSTTNYRYTAPFPMYLMFFGQIQFFVVNTVLCQSYLYKNGANFRAGTIPQNLSGGNNNVISKVDGIIPLGTGDYIELWGATNAGGASTVSNTSDRTFLEAIMICRT